MYLNFLNNFYISNKLIICKFISFFLFENFEEDNFLNPFVFDTVIKI